MQPTLTQVPPSSAASASATRAPVCAAMRAARTPPLPPPMTKRSKSNGCMRKTLLAADCSGGAKAVLAAGLDGWWRARIRARRKGRLTLHEEQHRPYRGRVAAQGLGPVRADARLPDRQRAARAQALVLPA